MDRQQVELRRLARISCWLLAVSVLGGHASRGTFAQDPTDNSIQGNPPAPAAFSDPIGESQSIRDGQGNFSASEIEYFEKYIRPVLVDSCLDCHSAESELSGGLSLDSRDDLLRGGDTGPGIDLQSPATSRLLQAISYENPNLQMPPEQKLPADVVQAFRRWIELGAPDPRTSSNRPKNTASGLTVERALEHWAYQPFSSKTDVANGQLHSVDEFIDRRLAEHQIAAADQASDYALIRRLAFDLTGLPPSPEQVRAYVADETPDKYDRYVDELLAKRAFGETFARHWMDVARYAESVTLRGFVLPNAWRYRDYLIESFHADRSFATMIKEQIAGDLLPASNLRDQQRQLTATAFLALGNTNLEQQDKEQLEMDYIDEQLDVIGRAFLGQTIGCARCHDHKFDPIPTRDYYALAGILRGTQPMKHDNVSKWVDLPLPLDDAEQQTYDKLASDVAQMEKSVRKLTKELELSTSGFTDSQPIEALTGVVVDDTAARLVGTWVTSSFSPRYVGAGYRYPESRKSATTATFEPADLPEGSYEVRLAYSANSNRASNARVEVFSGDGETVLRIDQTKTPPIDKLWVSLGTYRFEKDGQAFVMLSSEDSNGHVIADAVQFLPVTNPVDTQSSGAIANATKQSTTNHESIASDSASSTAKQARESRLKTELANLQSELAIAKRRLSQRPEFLTIIQKEPRDVAIHVRGNVHAQTVAVRRGVLTAFGPRIEIADDQGGRLQLADWIASAENPLTARVYANRVWNWLMGQGIVSSLDNFGTTGFPPTHPELLDWLATELIQSGWSTKHLVRIIVSSSAYRRKLVAPTEELRKLDPANQLFWRGQQRRLTVEALRDAMLVCSGELEEWQGGSTIRPGTAADYSYQHEGTFRSIYNPVFRNSLPELFEAFDFADPSAPVGKRARSTVATQALVLSNHPWVVARAKATADRIMSEVGTDSAAGMVERLYQLCFQRTPTAEEDAIARQFLLSNGTSDVDSMRLQYLAHSLFASIDFRYPQ